MDVCDFIIFVKLQTKYSEYLDLCLLIFHFRGIFLLRRYRHPLEKNAELEKSFQDKTQARSKFQPCRRALGIQAPAFAFSASQWKS